MRLSQCITRAAHVAPAKTATTFADRSRSWREFADRVARLASALRGLGVGTGDRVAFLGRNSDRHLEWFFAVGWAGAVFVPVNHRLARPEVEDVLGDSGARVLFAGDDVATDFDCEHLVYAGEAAPPGPAWHAYEDLIAASDPIAPEPGDGSELAGLFYTGGTTGRSKGVMLSHDNLVANALHTIPETGWSADSVYLHAAPMFHVANGTGMMGMAVCGATNAIVDRFDPAAMVAEIDSRQVTHLVLVPTMIAMLVDELERERRDLPSVRGVFYGGSPMSEAVIRRTLRALPGVELCQSYGQTEAAPAMTILGPERHVFEGPLAGKARSGGRAALGVEVTIRDERGDELPRGEIGEICGRGDNVMLGYWNQPEATREALRDGWLHTGDLGWMDGEGFVFVVDRLKDMIVTGGENVASVEVENAIYEHAAVAECAVIGIPSERWGEQVHAVVVPRDGARLDSGELLAHCRARIAGYKCPRSVDVRAEPLPKSGAGKILKSVLRTPYWEREARAVG